MQNDVFNDFHRKQHSINQRNQHLIDTNKQQAMTNWLETLEFNRIHFKANETNFEN